MGIFSALSGNDNPKNTPKPAPRAKVAARAARRGGNAVVATTRQPRAGRVTRVRGGV